MTTYSMTEHVDKTIEVLAELSHFEPRKPRDRRTTLENRAQTFANWTMALAVLTMLASWVIAAALVGLEELNQPARMVILIVVTCSAILALLSFVAPIFASAIAVFKWKDIALNNFLEDIRHEHAMVCALATHSQDVLDDTKYWLELKIKRLESRVSYFFGEKTALLTLLASSYLFLKEFGGLSWLSTTITGGVKSGNVMNMSLMYAAAAVLGMSVGAVLTRHIAGLYRYQLELVECALRQKG